MFAVTKSRQVDGAVAAIERGEFTILQIQLRSMGVHIVRGLAKSKKEAIWSGSNVLLFSKKKC